MAAKQKLDKMKINVNIGTTAAPVTYEFFFLGQKESYTELGLSETECGVDEPSATELAKNLPQVKVDQLIKSGHAVRMKARGSSSTGKTVSRSILVSQSKVATAITAVNDGTKPIIDGAEMTLSIPTRRRLV